jgi:hypothetical protein
MEVRDEVGVGFWEVDIPGFRISCMSKDALHRWAEGKRTRDKMFVRGFDLPILEPLEVR